MSARVSIHIGCESVRWNPALGTVGIAKTEVEAAGDLAARKNFTAITTLLSTFKAGYTAATTTAVSGALSQAVTQLTLAGGGDLFVTFMGHTLRKSMAPNNKEASPCAGANAMEEFIALEDDTFCDNNFANAWAALPSGSRVLFVADCCYGTGLGWIFIKYLVRPLVELLKWMFRSLATRLTPSYSCPALAVSDATTIDAGVVILSLASEDLTTRGGLASALRDVLTSGNPPANYDDLIVALEKLMSSRVYACKFGAGANAMWNAAPLA